MRNEDFIVAVRRYRLAKAGNRYQFLSFQYFPQPSNLSISAGTERIKITSSGYVK
jgi:hypothetical protein